MSIQDQAIQIERLKYERDEAKNATFSEMLSVSREIDSITNEMFRLGEKRKKLYDKLGELKEKRARDEAHYALVISARQALTKRDKEAKCLTCSNVADACTPEDGPCDDEPENNVDSSFREKKTNEGN